MKVFFHEAFYAVYAYDPAAAAGRMEAIVNAIRGEVSLTEVLPAVEADLLRVHTARHIAAVRQRGVFEIASLAAGGAIQAAAAGLAAPAFAVIRPPGHHASVDRCWGFCYFNNMAVALMRLHYEGRIASALVLDFDLHYGDGTVNTMGHLPWVTILNPEAASATDYLAQVEAALAKHPAEVIGVSAGFDNHREDWGGLLATEDYQVLGRLVRAAARRNRGGCFGLLEGGYNHAVLGDNVMAFLRGLDGG